MPDDGQTGQPAEVMKETTITVTRIHEQQKTIRTAIICAMVVLIVLVAAWTVIRVYTHHFWLEVLLLLFGPTGIVTLLLFWFLRRVERKSAAVGQQLQQVPSPEPPEAPKAK